MNGVIDLTDDSNVIEISVLSKLYGCLKLLNHEGSVKNQPDDPLKRKHYETLEPVQMDSSGMELKQRVLDLYMQGKTIREIGAEIIGSNFDPSNMDNFDQVVYLLLDYLWITTENEAYHVPHEFSFGTLFKELYLVAAQVGKVRDRLTYQTNPSVRCLLQMALSPIQTAVLLTVIMLQQSKNAQQMKLLPDGDADLSSIKDIESLVTEVTAKIEQIEKLREIDHQKYHDEMKEIMEIIPLIDQQIQEAEEHVLETGRMIKEVKDTMMHTLGQKVANAPEAHSFDDNHQSLDNDVTVVQSAVNKDNYRSRPRLPPADKMPKLKLGDKVFCKMPCLPEEDRYVWLLGDIVDIMEVKGGEPRFTVRFEKSQMKTKYPVRNAIVTGKHLAYSFEPPWLLNEGERVVGHWRDDFETQFDGWYSAIIAEKPGPTNNYRYLVFFDDQSVAYSAADRIRLVYSRQTNPKSNYTLFERKEKGGMHFTRADEMYCDFIRHYLLHYPYVEKLVIRDIGSKLSVLRDGLWLRGNKAPTVVKIDASLVRVMYADGSEEVIYRGSPRIAINSRKTQRSGTRVVRRPTHRRQHEYEYENEIDSAGTQDRNPQTARKSTTQRRRTANSSSSEEEVDERDNPEKHDLIQVPLADAVFKNLNLPPTNHICNENCEKGMIQVPAEPIRHFAGQPPFMIPLLLGWQRHLVHNFVPKMKPVVMYETPCGKTLRKCGEVSKYLLATNSCMSVDYFSFDSRLRPCTKYRTLDPKFRMVDYSKGVERLPIECVNSFYNEAPMIINYARKRFPKDKSVTISKICSTCDCVDDCSDPLKCACQQLTEHDVESLPKDARPVRGIKQYVYRRLHERILSGIYECNRNCKCSKNRCVNRVAQHDISIPLQLFKTLDKGWGVRTLVDIPRGQFICIYAGAIYTDKLAETLGKQYGDEYFADLDLIAVCEDEKLDYEEEAEEMTDSESEKEEEKLEYIKEETIERKDPLFKLYTAEPVGTARKSARIKQIPRSDSTHASKGTSAKNKASSRKEEKQKKKSKGLNLVEYFNNSEANYPFIIDAKKEGNVGRYMNHSCSPNVFVQNVFLETHDIRLPDVAFFAMTFIHAGQELCWDYNYELGSTNKMMPCKCNADNCRKRLL